MAVTVDYYKELELDRSWDEKLSISLWRKSN